LVACRVTGVSSSVQRGQGLPASVLTEPQNGQMCWIAGDAAGRVVDSVGPFEAVRLMSRGSHMTTADCAAQHRPPRWPHLRYVGHCRRAATAIH
jgi:hypothetical protein